MESRMTVAELPGDSQSLAAQFAASLERVLGSCERVESRDAVADVVVRRIVAWAAELEAPTADPTIVEVLSWAPGELPVPELEDRMKEHDIRLLVPADLHDDQSRARAAACGIGLTSVDAAFASTGSVALAPGPGRSRAASLLPLRHIMLVPLSRIYPTVEDWLRSLRQAGRLSDLLQRSAQIVFVTGPSKSADIELILALGVHGPQVVHAVVFDDTNEG
jgi:L-lactate dehydrogenase complex protein LldG